MKQYGNRFTYFVSLLVSGYLFWGRRIYIHWPIKWPLGIFNGGAAWSLLALANVCLCVIEYFMGRSKFSAETLLISSLHRVSTSFHGSALRLWMFESRVPLSRVNIDFCVLPFQLSHVFIVGIYLLTVFISRLTFTLCFNKLILFPTSFFHSAYECSRCITSIQVEIASLSFLFFIAAGLIPASLLFEWPAHGAV